MEEEVEEEAGASVRAVCAPAASAAISLMRTPPHVLGEDLGAIWRRPTAPPTTWCFYPSFYNQYCSPSTAASVTASVAAEWRRGAPGSSLGLGGETANCS